VTVATQRQTWLKVCRDCVDSVHIPRIPEPLWFIPLGMWLSIIFGMAAYVSSRIRKNFRRLSSHPILEPNCRLPPGIEARTPP
jgi:hypothetical protein